MSDSYSPGTGIPLATLSKDASVPSTRLSSAAEVCNLVSILKTANDKRAKTEAKVRGLVDGNPPYKAEDLKNAGQSWRSNANMRESEAFLASATGAFYDILQEAPTLASVEIEFGSTEDHARLSRIVTEEFDKLNKEDSTLDFMFQLSQHEMVLYGLGPVLWENEWDFHCRAIPKGKLLVPDGTSSNLGDWEVAAVLVDYMPHQLYGFIKDEKHAKAAGWDVKAVQQALINAAPKTEGQDGGPDWNFVQQQIRNNDLSYSARSKTIPVAHVFYREFRKDGEREGSISHCMVLSESSGEGYQQEFLFRKLNRYGSWQQVIVPFYYDVGDGTHHSVKGMGIKFYSALELKNRLSNTIVDTAIERAKMPVEVGSVEAGQSFQIIPSGPYTLYPPGTKPIPVPTGGVLDAPMAVARELLATTASNTSQYRQNLQRDRGNPITAAEVQVRAEQQSLLGKTQINRYYAQLDAFWTERYRRLINPGITAINPGGLESAAFKARCAAQGVPEQALRAAKSVKATRVAGQGSPFLRQMAIQNLMQIAGSLGSDGRMALLEDMIGSQAGQEMVDRYLPASDRSKVPTHDAWEASMEHSAMRVGSPPPVVGSQNHVVHFEQHMGAGVQALNSMEQGGNPDDVLAFVDQVGPHMAAHLQELSADPTRQREFKLLEEQFKEFSKVADELRKDVQATAEQRQKAMAAQQQAQAIAAGTDPETMIKAAQAMADAKIKMFEAQSNAEIKRFKGRQDAALKDAKTANQIRTDGVMARHQIAMDRASQMSKEGGEGKSGKELPPINIAVQMDGEKSKQIVLERDNDGGLKVVEPKATEPKKTKRRMKIERDEKGRPSALVDDE